MSRHQVASDLLSAASQLQAIAAAISARPSVALPRPTDGTTRKCRSEPAAHERRADRLCHGALTLMSARESLTVTDLLEAFPDTTRMQWNWVMTTLCRRGWVVRMPSPRTTAPARYQITTAGHAVLAALRKTA